MYNAAVGACGKPTNTHTRISLRILHFSFYVLGVDVCAAGLCMYSHAACVYVGMCVCMLLKSRARSLPPAYPRRNARESTTFFPGAHGK